MCPFQALPKILRASSQQHSETRLQLQLLFVCLLTFPFFSLVFLFLLLCRFFFSSLSFSPLLFLQFLFVVSRENLFRDCNAGFLSFLFNYLLFLFCLNLQFAFGPM